jgi:hypothetical protein
LSCFCTWGSYKYHLQTDILLQPKHNAAKCLSCPLLLPLVGSCAREVTRMDWMCRGRSAGRVFEEWIHSLHQESLLYHPPLAEINKENGHISERLWQVCWPFHSCESNVWVKNCFGLGKVLNRAWLCVWLVIREPLKAIIRGWHFFPELDAPLLVDRMPFLLLQFSRQKEECNDITMGNTTSSAN